MSLAGDERTSAGVEICGTYRRNYSSSQIVFNTLVFPPARLVNSIDLNPSKFKKNAASETFSCSVHQSDSEVPDSTYSLCARLAQLVSL